MMGGWYGDWGWGAWVVMAFMMLLFWGLVIGLVVVVIRGTSGLHRHDAGVPTNVEDHASRILDERFARGDIDADEYRSRRDLLRSR